MAGKGRASVDDMKRVEVSVLLAIDDCGGAADGLCELSRKDLAQRVGVSPYRARAALDRLSGEGLVELVSRYNEDGGQLANGICLTERGAWYLAGVRAGMLVSSFEAPQS